MNIFCSHFVPALLNRTPHFFNSCSSFEPFESREAEVIGCQEFNCVCKSVPGGRHKETPFYQSLLAHKLIGFLGHQHSKDGNSSSSSSKTNCLLKGLKWNNYSYTCSHIRKLLLYKKEGA